VELGPLDEYLRRCIQEYSMMSLLTDEQLAQKMEESEIWTHPRTSAMWDSAIDRLRRAKGGHCHGERQE
jgi:hypothetical protein